MDKNKLKVLRDINYKVNKSCNFCKFSDLSPDGWGYCNKHTYSHLKHNEKLSRLSINAYGSCEKFEINDSKLYNLGAFKEFLGM